MFKDPAVQAPSALLLKTQGSWIPSPSSPRLQELGSPAPSSRSIQKLSPQASPVLKSFRPFPGGVHVQGQPPDLHVAPDSCGGPALPPVQVPIPALAMTLVASSQRSQIIRSKFRSGERLLSVGSVLSVHTWKWSPGSGEFSNLGSVHSRVRCWGQWDPPRMCFLCKRACMQKGSPSKGVELWWINECANSYYNAHVGSGEWVARGGCA